MIFIDTHLALWLFSGELRRIPAPVQARLEGEDLGISPISALELSYLHQIGRTTVSADEMVSELARALGLTVATAPFEQICAAATNLTWTRDLFDRLLSAHSIVSGQTLVTRDETILRNLPSAWWSA